MEPGGGGGEGGGRRIRGADNKALLGMMQRPPPSPTNTSTSTSGSASVSSTSAGSGTTGGGSRTSSYLDFLIGDPVHRQAKAQLNRYRASLAAEAARAEAGAQRGWRALTAFETEARRDGEQLARTGGRHLALFEYICGLRASLLRLELAQWRSAARLLRAREGEVGRWLEGKGGVQALLAEAGGDRLDERVHLRPSPQELLAGNAELAALRRRAGLLAPVCEGVGAEASLLVLQGTGAGGGGGGGGGPGGGSAAAGQGCEGCGMGLEGPVEAVEERRRRLQLLAEEASVLYFGGASSAGHGAAAGGGSGGGDEEEKEEPSSRPALSPAEEGAAGNGSGPLGSLQRQREVLLRRLRCEREFAQLVADERQREGRLLARWLEVLRDVAGEEEDEDGGEDGGGREMEPPQQSSHAARTHAHAHSRSLSGSHAAAAAGGGGGGLSSSISSSATGGGGLFPACDAPVHAPRCIAAFVKYLAKRVKDAYQLDDGLKSALVGLTQALVFRRARRVCFGYVKGARMRRLNRLWREKMLLVRQLSPQALGVPDAYISSSSSTAIGGGSSYGGGDSGSRREGAPPYHETSRALGAMALCLTPQEMSDCLLTAVRVLHVEARLASGSEAFVDADTMFPILLYALAQADVPDMYSCLYCLKHFAGADWVGETAYFITTLAAAVSHLQMLEVERVEADTKPGDGSDGGGGPVPAYRVRPPALRKDSNGGGGGGEAVVGAGTGAEEEDFLEAWGPAFGPAETRRALEYLDGWLAMELNMEETIDLLETGGWW